MFLDMFLGMCEHAWIFCWLLTLQRLEQLWQDFDHTCTAWTAFRLGPPVCTAVLTPMKQQQDCFGA